MEPNKPRRTLVVANRTAAAPVLLEAIARRRDECPTVFVLLRGRKADGLDRRGHSSAAGTRCRWSSGERRGGRRSVRGGQACP